MVTIIEEANKNINKNCFLNELKKKQDGISLKVIKVYDPNLSRNKREDYIYIDFKILEDFKGYFKDTAETNEIKQAENIKDEIIALPFTLSLSDETGNYKITNGKNIFNILNYGLKQKKLVPAGNDKGFYITFKEISEALSNLEFKGTAKEVKSNDFNNYLRLEVVE